MNKKRILPLILLATALIAGSCKRTNADYLGPKQVAAGSDFQVLSAKHYNYDEITKVKTAITASGANARINLNSYSNRYLLDAQFSQEVTWYLTITQPKTGAEFKTQGTSSKIDSSVFLWRAKSTNHIFFDGSFVLDSCYLKVEFLGSDVTIEKALRLRTIATNGGGSEGYPAYYASLGRKLLVIDNFDGTDLYNRTTQVEGTDSRLSQEFADAVDGTVILENSLEQKIDKSKSFHFKGRDSNKNSYIGGVNTFSLTSIAVQPPGTAAESQTGVTDPADLYFNCYIYGVVNQSSVQVKIYEIDDVANFPAVTSSYSYGDHQNSNDAWIYDINVDWSGWKLVSICYKDFKRANDPNAGGNGNGIREPNKVTGIAITLTSQDAFPDGEIYLDYVTLSTYGPFTP